MTTHVTGTSPAPETATARSAALVIAVNRLLARIPHSFLAALARFSIAAVFWKSGQTKVDGFAIDILDGTIQLGWPRLTSSAVALFRDEYRVPLLPPEVAAMLAAFAEHVLPVLLLVGLATRFSALGLLAMTAVIQIFVYPQAYPTHGVWAAVLLLLIARGPGALSIDRWIERRYAGTVRAS